MDTQLPSQVDAFSSAWLSGVAAASVDKLRALSSRVDVGDKRVVYAQGKEQPCLWGVVQGEVRVQVALAEMEPTLGHIHHRGAWFGESEPLLELPGIVEMRAAGDTVVERIDYAKFRRLAGRHPELWEALARLASMNQLLATSTFMKAISSSISKPRSHRFATIAWGKCRRASTPRRHAKPCSVSTAPPRLGAGISPSS